MDYILSTANLTKQYGKNTVVNAVNLHVRQGEIYGLIGKNGAGKTTFLRMVGGLAAPTSGEMEDGTSLAVEADENLSEEDASNENLSDENSLGCDRRCFDQCQHAFHVLLTDQYPGGKSPAEREF